MKTPHLVQTMAGHYAETPSPHPTETTQQVLPFGSRVAGSDPITEPEAQGQEPVVTQTNADPSTVPATAIILLPVIAVGGMVILAAGGFLCPPLVDPPAEPGAVPGI